MDPATQNEGLQETTGRAQRALDWLKSWLADMKTQFLALAAIALLAFLCLLILVPDTRERMPEPAAEPAWGAS